MNKPNRQISDQRVPQIVIDSNVLVAALRCSRGASYKLVSLIGRGDFEINVSVSLVVEYEEVMLRRADTFGAITSTDIVRLLDYLCSVANRREVFYLWRPALPDPDDELVLKVAVSAGCDTIVTHNWRDFRGSEQFGVRVLTPAAFLLEIAGA